LEVEEGVLEEGRDLYTVCHCPPDALAVECGNLLEVLQIVRLLDGLIVKDNIGNLWFSTIEQLNN
jgi:hypothetical protein